VHDHLLRASKWVHVAAALVCVQLLYVHADIRLEGSDASHPDRIVFTNSKGSECTLSMGEDDQMHSTCSIIGSAVLPSPPPGPSAPQPPSTPPPMPPTSPPQPPAEPPAPPVYTFATGCSLMSGVCGSNLDADGNLDRGKMCGRDWDKVGYYETSNCPYPHHASSCFATAKSECNNDPDCYGFSFKGGSQGWTKAYFRCTAANWELVSTMDSWGMWRKDSPPS